MEKYIAIVEALRNNSFDETLSMEVNKPKKNIDTLFWDKKQYYYSLM